MFDYYLKKRSEFLTSTGKTLADFGILEDDTEKLRKEFYIRLAKHVSSRALRDIGKVIDELSVLRSKKSMFDFQHIDSSVNELISHLRELMPVK
jgi:16S rRNA G527 N7-methylase RsmG